MLEKLDSDKIKIAIEPKNASRLVRLDIFETISSTNTYLLTCARKGALAGTICFAEQQNKGRGRLAREWFSPPGNITCSILWRFVSPRNDLPALSLAVGVMVANALKKYGIQAGIGLKWPNDVLFLGKKLAGILLESFTEDKGVTVVVIGIGLNMQLPNHDHDSQWIDVAQITGQSVNRNLLAGLLVNELLDQLDIFAQQGLRAFRKDWQALDVFQGKKVQIRSQADVITGVMQGIGENGELLIKNENSTIQAFQCGEVSCSLD